MIYNIVYDKQIDQFRSVPAGDRYPVPKKIYGTLMDKAYRVWNDYMYNLDKSTGAMLTGDSGAGKTLLASLICNVGIDNGLPVYSISGSGSMPTGGDGDKAIARAGLFNILDGLSKCIIFIDEFGKLLEWGDQESSLTMFSDLNKTRKIFIITENEKHIINRFIRNRPGRIKYHYDFEKIEPLAVKEYCFDNNVNEKFMKDILDKLDSVDEFSFDQLQAIVNEHIKYPKDTLDDILGCLNAEVLRKPKLYKLVKVLDKNNNKPLEFLPLNNLDAKSHIGYDTYGCRPIIQIKIDEKDLGNYDPDLINKVDDKYYYCFRPDDGTRSGPVRTTNGYRYNTLKYEIDFEEM